MAQGPPYRSGPPWGIAQPPGVPPAPPPVGDTKALSPFYANGDGVVSGYKNGSPNSFQINGAKGSAAVLFIWTSGTNVATTATDSAGSVWVPLVLKQTDGNVGANCYVCYNLLAANPTVTITWVGSAALYIAVPVSGGNNQFLVDVSGFKVHAGSVTTLFPPVYSISSGDLFVSGLAALNPITSLPSVGYGSTTVIAPSTAIDGDTAFYAIWSLSPVGAGTAGPTWQSGNQVCVGITVALRAANVGPSQLSAYPPPGVQGVTPRMPWTAAPPGYVETLAPPPPASRTITPPAGTITLTGYGPTMDLGIAPPAGTITLTGVGPIMNLGIAPPAGTITLTGLASTLNLGIKSLVGTITLTGLAPILNLGITPLVGAIVLSGVASTLNLGIAPGAGAIVLNGTTPQFSWNVFSTIGVITLSGVAPILNLGIAPGVGVITLSGLSPLLGLGIVPTVGAIILSGAAPVLPVVLTPAIAALVLAGSAIQMNLGIVPSAAVLTLIGNIPFSGQMTETPGAGSLSISGVVPSLAFSIQPPMTVLVLAGNAPVINTVIPLPLYLLPAVSEPRPPVSGPFGYLLPEDPP